MQATDFHTLYGKKVFNLRGKKSDNTGHGVDMKHRSIDSLVKSEYLRGKIWYVNI